MPVTSILSNFPVASAYCLYISNSSRREDGRQNMKVNKCRKHCENAGYQHPLPFPQCFKRPISLRQGYIAYMYISIVQENKTEDSMKADKSRKHIVRMGEDADF